MHRGKHHTNCIQVIDNHVSPDVGILVTHVVTHITLLWYNSSYNIMIIKLQIYIIQSLDQNKLTIISDLRILSIGKLAPQTRLVY